MQRHGNIQRHGVLGEAGASGMILLPVGCEKGQSERRKARVKETRKEATVMIQARETL